MTNLNDKPAFLGRHYLIATDGACRGNPGPGGWGAIIQLRDGDRLLRQAPKAGHVPDTTNNRMELEAVIRALTALKEPLPPVRLLSDSQYVVRGMTEWLPKWTSNGWRASGKPVMNQDLWRTLEGLAGERPIQWVWVRGHNNHSLNEMADHLASNAAVDLYRRRGLAVCDMHHEWVV